MSFGKNHPAGPLSKLRYWGLSRHGLVQDGVLTLENGDQLPWRQPSMRTEEQPWTAGNTHLVRRPGWVGPDIPAAEVASNLAAGHDFRDYAILSGASCDLGKRSLSGGWLWFDSTGACHSFTLNGIAGPNTALVLSFARRRFGLVDGTGIAPATTVSTDPLDLGQYGAPLLKYRTARGNYRVAVPESINPTPMLVSVTPDGSRSLWMVSVKHFPLFHGEQSAWADKPLAFIEIVVASDGQLSGAVIRDRAACMGTLETSSAVAPTTVWRATAEVTSTVTLPVCPDNPTGPPRLQKTYVGGLSQHAYPYQDGFFFTIPGGKALAATWDAGIIAMWYDADGDLHEIKARATHTFESVVTPTWETAGSYVRTEQCSGAQTYTGSAITTKIVQDWSVAESLKIELLDNGIPVAEPSREVITGGQYSVTMHVTLSPWAGNLVRYETVVSTSTSADGVEVFSEESTRSGADLQNSYPGGFNFNDPDLALSGLFYPPSGDSEEVRSAPFDVFPCRFALSPSHSSVGSHTKGELLIDFVRYSNAAIGSVYRRWLESDGDISPTTPHPAFFGNVYTAWGAIEHSDSAEAAYRSAPIVSGSVQPVTKQFAAAVLFDPPGSSTPVLSPKCWV